MIAIRNFTDTLNEYKIAKGRLGFLLGLEEVKRQRYCGLKSTSIAKVDNSSKRVKGNNVPAFLDAMNRINEKTGLSLSGEIMEQEAMVNTLSCTLMEMANNLRQMEGVEYQLYYAIVIKGLGITGGVEYVAERTEKDAGTIWKYYYPRIEKEIKKLRIVQ